MAIQAVLPAPGNHFQAVQASCLRKPHAARVLVPPPVQLTPRARGRNNKAARLENGCCSPMFPKDQRTDLKEITDNVRPLNGKRELSSPFKAGARFRQ